MNAEWDIVSDVFPGTQVVENKTRSRRATRVPSSKMVAMALAISPAIAPTATVTRVIGGVSGSSFVLSSERIRRQPPGISRVVTGADFPNARSAEQLARSFEAFFGPSAHHDEDDQVSYVFS